MIVEVTAVPFSLSVKDKMAYVAKGEKDYDATGAQIPAAKAHKIRITLTSSNVANLEKCAYFLLSEYCSKRRD